MKATVLSNCERNFILRAASELKRLDGRKLEAFRNVSVHFGSDWGLCYVTLGETKVLSQVTCEIQEPKTTKPNEGLLFINVELSSIEAGKASNLSVHINRLLEKCIKDSRAVDLESLCIVVEDKVWVLKVDINILNHDGNLVDCASISALAALAHFKRPDITTDGVEIKVHSILERDPIPITLHHYPVCVSFALLSNSENIFADPTAIEERVSDASLTFGINAYQEICCLHLGGAALINPKLILTCSLKAAIRAKEIVGIIHEALQRDSEARQLKKPIGFVHAFEWDKITAMSEKRLKVQLSKFNNNNNKQKFQSPNSQLSVENEHFEIIDLGDNCAELSIKPTKNSMTTVNVLSSPTGADNKDSTSTLLANMTTSIGEGGPSTWEIDMEINPEKSSSEKPEETSKSRVQAVQVETNDLSGGSEEEEEVVILNVLNPSQSQSKIVKQPLSKTKKTFLK